MEQVFVLIADPELGHRSRATGVLPFRLRRQAITGAVKWRDRLTRSEVERLEFFLLTKFRTELGSVIPGHPLHWMPACVQAGNGIFSFPGRSEV